MGPIDINGWEIVVLAVLAIFVLGPERLPEYAARLGRLVRRGRALADGARAQLKDQLGPDFDDVDWAAYDPRQYDPRRIVREALAAPAEPVKPVSAGAPTEVGPTTAAPAEPPMPGSAAVAEAAAQRHPEFDPSLPTPWDADAT